VRTISQSTFFLTLSSVPALQKNTIKRIHFSFQHLNELQIIDIACCLAKNTSLTRLCLNSIEMTDKAAKSIAQALLVNSTLTHLDVGGNELKGEVGTAFANSLLKNTTLTFLDLS